MSYTLFCFQINITDVVVNKMMTSLSSEFVLYIADAVSHHSSVCLSGVHNIRMIVRVTFYGLWFSWVQLCSYIWNLRSSVYQACFKAVNSDVVHRGGAFLRGGIFTFTAFILASVSTNLPWSCYCLEASIIEKPFFLPQCITLII